MSRKFFALEEAEVVDTAAGELTAEDVVQANEGVDEVEVEAAEVDELATAIEDAEVAVDNLEETAEVLQAGVDSGEGVSEETAQAAEIAVEAALNMLGASHRQRSLMPSLESWGSGQSRLSATKIALEGVSDKVKEIWKKVVEFVKMIAQKVGDFFAKFFDNTERLKKNVVKVRAKVNEAAGSKPKESTLKNGGVTKAFNNGEGKTDFATASAILKTHTSSSEATTAAMALLPAAANSLKSGDGENTKKAMENFVQKALGQTAKAHKEGNDAGVVSGPMLGGRRVFLSVGAEGEAVTAEFRVLEPAKKSVKEAAALDKAQCLELLTQVEELAKATEEYKKCKKNLDDLVKTTAALADAALKAADEEGSMAGARKTVTAMARVSSRYVTMMPAWNVKAGNMALNYVLASVANFEEKK